MTLFPVIWVPGDGEATGRQAVHRGAALLAHCAAAVLTQEGHDGRTQSTWQASGLVPQFADVVRSGRDDPGVTGTVEELLGRAPVPVTEFIWRTRDFRR